MLQQTGKSDCSLGDESSVVQEEDNNNNNNSNNSKPAEKQQQVIAKDETSVVIRLRLIVFLVLVISTVVAAISVHRYISHGEESKFEDQFHNDAQKIIEAIGSSLEKTLSALDSLAVTLVSHAQSTNASWPFVTLPHYGLKVSKLLPLSNCLYINLLPIVTPRQRRKWEEYSLRHDYWVNESIALLETWDGFHGRIIKDWTPDPILRDFEHLPYNLTRIYLPAWQSFPIVAEYPPYGYDWLTAADPMMVSMFHKAIETHHAILGGAYLLPVLDDEEEQKQVEEWAKFYSDYIPPTENPMEPVSDFYYPIINAVDRVETLDSDGNSTKEVVGLLAAPMYWRAMIRGNLPSDSKGVVVVFESPCNEPFTYQINGPNSTYLGVGDRHDRKYDHMVVPSALPQEESYINTHSQYSGARMDSEFCPMTMRFYPSDIMKSEFTTRSPRIMTVLAVAIFVFTSIVFILYDYYVERRQGIVLGTATRSSAIVSSLFPEAVQDRLYPMNSEPPPDGAKNRLQSFLRDTSKSDSTVAYGRLAGTPIAELYPNTTVFFADIAGFTSWSAARQPTQVFTLLETMYGSFDEIANKLGVFKIETIGDCYVAVVGLPVPRKHHAVVMARFAQECMDAMKLVTTELEEELGPGTTDLALRIGLNSGPTTAGVLRGEKPRFQLFGDTVNTAARMESNGKPHQIHVSQVTADLIVKDGKGHWLTARAETIHAKGKGEMQTYWCTPTTDTTRTEVSTESAVPESTTFFEL